MKNRHYSILVFLISIFSIFSIDTCFAFDENDYTLTYADCVELRTTLVLSITDQQLAIFRDLYNNWAIDMEDEILNPGFSFLSNSVIFFKTTDTDIYWTINHNFSNYTAESGEQYQKVYLSNCSASSSYIESSVLKFINWDIPSYITSATTSAIKYWYVNFSSNPITLQNKDNIYAKGPFATSSAPSSLIINSDNNIEAYSNRFLVFSPAKSPCQIYGYSTQYSYNTYFLTHFIANTDPIIPTPTPTSSPTNVPTSTLDSIESSITNIQDSLTNIPSSGDFNEISSGEIISSIGLPPVVNPYSDFFGQLIDGLYDALVDDTITTLTFPFLSDSFIIDATEWEIDYPPSIKIFLPVFWTVIISFVIMKMFNRMRIMIETGRHLSLASDLSKMDISDLL